MSGSLLPGCARTLPDQDRRIHAAAPVAKLSADLLWKEYAADAAAANARYWGQAIEVSGAVAEVFSAQPNASVVLGVPETPGVRAVLLDDDAAAILARATPGTRITLKCFCAGMDGQVVVRSCVGK